MQQQLGPYRILEELGRGGMGAVYRAQDERDGSTVAIKVLVDGVPNLEILERFRREALVLQKIQHPNLVRLLDAAFQPPRPYAVFEYIPGGTLETQVGREGPLPWPKAVHLLSELAAGVATVHEHHVLHRDIKPANVLLAEGGAKLADFGLVKDFSRSTLTDPGATLGTPGYLAPEQVGAEEGRLGAVTDVYGLAATLYFALTGSAPFMGPTTIATLRAVLTDPPLPLRSRVPSVPSWLDELCVRGLAKRGEDRFPSVLAFRAALLDRAGGDARGPRSRYQAFAALAFVLALAAALGVWRLVATNSAPAEAPHLAAEREPRADGPGLPELAVGEHDEEAESLTQEALTLLRGGRLEEALGRLDQAVLLDPRRSSAYRVRGRVLVALERHEDALPDLERALQIDPTDLPSLLSRGFCNRELNRPVESLQDYDRALELDPTSAVGYRCRGVLKLNLDQAQGALDDFERSLDLSPRQGPAIHMNRALAKTRLGRWEEALRDYDLALERGSELEPKSLINAHKQRGMTLEALGRPREALASYNWALARRPDDARGLASRGGAWRDLGEHEKALADFDRAIELDSRNVWARAGRGEVLAMLERYAEALLEFDQVLQMDEHHLQACVNRGLVLAELGRYEAALSDFEHALTLDLQPSEAERIRNLRVEMRRQLEVGR